MKKPSTWAGIFGVLLIGFSALGLVTVLSNPSILAKINAAMVLDAILHIALGFFLVSLFIKGRQKDDSNKLIQERIPGSTEDHIILAKQTNWILGFVLAFEVIGSAPLWLLNDYTVGLTLINIFVIFDLLANVVITYLFVELFRGKRDVSALLVYTILIFSVVEAGLDIGLHRWAVAVYSLLFGFYIIFAITSKVNRKNFRIAHLIILPVLILASFGVNVLDMKPIMDLQKQNGLIEGQYSNDTNTISGTYQLFLQRQMPNKAEIQDVIAGVEKREVRRDELTANLSKLEAAYKNRLPDVKQQEALQNIVFRIKNLDLDTQQGEKLKEFMEYALTLNFANLSSAQLDEIIARKNEIDSFAEKYTQLQFEQQEAHLTY